MKRKERRLPRRRKPAPDPRQVATGRGTGRRLPQVVLVVLFAVLAVAVYLQWDRLWPKPAPAVRPKSVAPQPPGAPPVDAAAILELPTTVPTGLEPLKEEATRVATQLTTALPGDAQSYAQLALLQAESGAGEAALDTWHQALDKDPAFAAAHLGMGTILARRAEFARAAESLQKAIDLDPDAPHAYRELIEVYLKDGKAEQAVPVAREFVNRFPGLANSHFWLGQALLQQGDYAGAQHHHSQAIDIRPDWSQPYSSLAQAYARLDQRDKALESRRKFAKLKASESAADRRQTRAYDDLEKQRQVTAKVHYAAGTLHLRHGAPRIAEAHWLRAAAIDPQDTRSREALVGLYTEQTRLAATARMLAELAELVPDEPRYATEQGRCHLAMGRLPEALQALQSVVQQHPSCAPAHLLLAQTYLQAGEQLSQARQHARQAVQLAGSSQSLLVLAAVFQQQGDLNAARETLSKAVAADPHNRQLRQAYEQLRSSSE